MTLESSQNEDIQAKTEPEIGDIREEGNQHEIKGSDPLQTDQGGTTKEVGVEVPSDTASKKKIRQPGQRWKSILTSLLWAMVIVALLLIIVPTLLVTIPTFFGYGNYVVYSGSMEPTIPVGSVAITELIEPKQLKVGDIITFQRRAGVNITHRIVKFNDDGSLVTKGDANPTPDADYVVYKEKAQRVITSIPQVGYLLDFEQSSMGHIIFIVIPFIFLAGLVFWHFWE